MHFMICDTPFESGTFLPYCMCTHHLNSLIRSVFAMHSVGSQNSKASSGQQGRLHVCPAKTQTSMYRCAGWSESLLDTHAILYEMQYSSSFLQMHLLWFVWYGSCMQCCYGMSDKFQIQKLRFECSGGQIPCKKIKNSVILLGGS